MSRGLRNHNPGNIRQSAVRYQGEIVPSADPAFKQFRNAAWGYRAVFMLLYTYQKKHKLYTLREMIGRYAPPGENHTEAYIRAVGKEAGVADDATLDGCDGRVMIPVVCAMSRVENGVPAIRADVEKGWRLFAETVHV